jgi:HK97 family phage portal protein
MIFTFLGKKAAATAPNPAQMYRVAGENWFSGLIGRTVGGVHVTQERAMYASVVYACVKVISETIGSLPVDVFKKEGGRRVPKDNHNLEFLLSAQPNPLHTAAEFWEMLAGMLALFGNCYAQIIRDAAENVTALYPIPSDVISAERAAGGNFQYRMTLTDGGQMVFPAREIFHVRQMMNDGVNGRDPVASAGRSIALALITETFATAYFKNDARPSVVLEMPGSASEEAVNRIRSQWLAKCSGENYNSVVLLEEGMKVSGISSTNVNSQLMESRRYQVAEIARFFRVPLHMINDLEKSSFSNIEQQSIDFYRSTILPFLTKFEQRARVDLFAPSEKATHYVKFKLDGLLRGEIATRYEAHARAISSGWKTPNEVRKDEDLDPLPGLDEPLLPLNMAPATQPREKKA